jgi:hypothetical protein
MHSVSLGKLLFLQDFLSKFSKNVLGFARVDLQMIKINFPNFQQSMSSFIVVIHEGRLPFFQKFPIVFSFTTVDLQMLEGKFCSFPAISLLARVVVAQDVVGEIETKANSAQLELELGLSLATQLSGT